MKHRIAKRRLVTYCVSFLACILVVIYAFDKSLVIRRYHIPSDAIDSRIRLALVTDLHSCAYGEEQAELLEAIRKEQPDAVLLGGDIVDDVLPEENAKIFLSAVSKQYPCYYVSGNHEFWSDRIAEIKKFIKTCGISVLEGENKIVEIAGQKLNICGVDDPAAGETVIRTQLERCGAVTDKSTFDILLAHRPSVVDSCRQYGFDLILAGHNHGGQWRIPFLLNGLVGPDDGLFPKYAGGLYHFENMDMIVSRGLARESSIYPRIFNRPELVIVTLEAG